MNDTIIRNGLVNEIDAATQKLVNYLRAAYAAQIADGDLAALKTIAERACLRTGHLKGFATADVTAAIEVVTR